MGSRLFVRSVAVVAALSALVVAGCESESETTPGPAEASGTPIPDETPVTSEPSPSGPVEPTLPASAKKSTKAGVDAFVRHYWKAVNYAQQTGDVRYLKRLQQPSCVGCTSGADGLKEIYERGGRVTGRGYRVTRIEFAQAPSGHWSLVVHTKVGDQVVRGAGDLNETYKGGSAVWLVGVSWIRGGWSMTTLEESE